MNMYSKISEYVKPYKHYEQMPFQKVPEKVKQAHLKHMLKHAPQIAKLLNLKITQLPMMNTAEAENQIVILQDNSTQKIWYLFSLATVMSHVDNEDNVQFPAFIEKERKQLRKQNPMFAPQDQSLVYLINVMKNNNTKKYPFSKKPFFLASKYGGILLNIVPVVRNKNGMSTYKINLLSLGYYAHPTTKDRLKNISSYGESNKENLMKMVQFSQFQTPRPEWKLMDASQKSGVPFYMLFLNTALKPGGVAPSRSKVGTYNKFVTYPESAYQLVNALYKLPNNTKKRLVHELGDGTNSVLSRIVKSESFLNVKLHSDINKRYKSSNPHVKKRPVQKRITSQDNLALIMRGWGQKGSQAANKKKKSYHLKSYTHGNLKKVPGLEPSTHLTPAEIKHSMKPPGRIRFAPDPVFEPRRAIIKARPQKAPRNALVRKSLQKPRVRSTPARYRNPNMLLY